MRHDIFMPESLHLAPLSYGESGSSREIQAMECRVYLDLQAELACMNSPAQHGLRHAPLLRLHSLVRSPRAEIQAAQPVRV